MNNTAAFSTRAFLVLAFTGIQAEGLAQWQALFRFLADNAGRMEAGEAEREFGRLAVEGFFEARGAGDVGPWLEHEDGTVYVRETRDHTRTYISLFGERNVDRAAEVRHPSHHARGLAATHDLQSAEPADQHRLRPASINPVLESPTRPLQEKATSAPLAQPGH